MASDQHLELYQQLLQAAYEEGTLSSSVVNHGGKTAQVQVSFTLTSAAEKRSPALERLLALANQV